MKALSYKQQSLLTELSVLFLLSVLIPFFNGSQIWPGNYGYTFSLVLLTCFLLPSIILFYRWLLPFTIGRKRYGLFVLLFPVYLLIYEINVRLGSVTGMHLSFLPEGYRNNLASGHPQDFSIHYINQTFEFTFLVLLSVTLLYLVKHSYKKQQQLYLLENDKLTLELKSLKSQLQPHFFFNTLNNLYALSTQGSPKTSLMISDLSDIMRYVLYESEQEKVSLYKEVNFIKSYIALEKIRHTDEGIIVFFVQGDINRHEIEPLLFLPMIENAFKHCLAKDIAGKYVKMVLSVDDDELIFQVSNPYIKSQPAITAGGIGLKNIKKRLDLVYPGCYQLDIDEQDAVFTVILTIQFSHST
jgi:sensor histidine kinase YesM